MLQSLLADRFHIGWHIDTKEEQVYFLLKGDKPVQLRPAKSETDFPWVGGPAGAAIMGDGIAGTNVTMQLLAVRLTLIWGGWSSTRPESPALSISASIIRRRTGRMLSVRFGLPSADSD